MQILKLSLFAATLIAGLAVVGAGERTLSNGGYVGQGIDSEAQLYSSYSDQRGHHVWRRYHAWLLPVEAPVEPRLG